MGLTFRSDLNRPLTVTEIDDNFKHFTGSHTVSGSIEATGSVTASMGFSGNLTGTASFAQTASYVNQAQTASYVLNSISSSFATTATTSNGVFTFTAIQTPGTITNGGLFYSSSGDFYFGSASAWYKLNP